MNARQSRTLTEQTAPSCLPASLPVAGEWLGDKRHGKGTCAFASGDKYQGEGGGTWINCCCCWTSQSGAWLLPAGMSAACMQLAGSHLAFMPATTPGEWREDKRHGQGICKFADGRKFRGTPSALPSAGNPWLLFGLGFCRS